MLTEWQFTSELSTTVSAPSLPTKFKDHNPFTGNLWKIWLWLCSYMDGSKAYIAAKDWFTVSCSCQEEEEVEVIAYTNVLEGMATTAQCQMKKLLQKLSHNLNRHLHPLPTAAWRLKSAFNFLWILALSVLLPGWVPCVKKWAISVKWLNHEQGQNPNSQLSTALSKYS